jgi:hypothetical protein
MKFLLFLPYYVQWHYTRGIQDLRINLSNIVKFVFNYFSISVLIHTIFYPWRRLAESYSKGFDPSDFFATLIVNTLMRVLGFVIRSVVIVIGLVATILSAALATVFFVGWIFFPLVIAFFIVQGLSNLI